MMNSEENGILADDFKFVLYTSFQKKEDAIGLALCEGLKELCEKKGIKNFELRLRLSNESKERWTREFIDKELSSHHAESRIKKIWVCGPPKMNETFDRSLEIIAPKLEISPTQFEVL